MSRLMSALKILGGLALLAAVAAGAYFAVQNGVFAGLFEQRNTFVEPPPPKVTFAYPVVQEVADSIEFTGSTRATAQVDLRARVGGYLKQIEFEDGEMVQQGDLLFVIEPAPFEAEKESALAQLQKAEANLQLAEANLERVTTLYRRGVATKQEYDVQVAERATAEAEVAVAKAAVTQTELDLGYTEILAPISGRIGRHLVDKGNLVQAEQTLLATIESIDPIHAYFYVSERDLLRFMEMRRQNMLPDPEATPPVLQMGLANEEGFPHIGHLDYREFGVDPSTGTIARRGVFDNPDNELIPGLFVRIRAEIGKPRPQVLVEERAIGSDQRGDFLLIVREDNTIEKRYVELGISVDGRRVVLDGLQTGERVVVNGLQRALPESLVDPEEFEDENVPPKNESPGQSEEAEQPPITRSDEKDSSVPNTPTKPVAAKKRD